MQTIDQGERAADGGGGGMKRMALGLTLGLHGVLAALLVGAGPRPSERPGRELSTAVRLIAPAALPMPAPMPTAHRVTAPHQALPSPLLVPVPAFVIDAEPRPSTAERSDPAIATAAAAQAAPQPPATEAQPAEEIRHAALPPEHGACSARGVARHYPLMLRERGVEGQVLLRVQVDEQGRAAAVVVQGGSGWRLLDEAARQVALACPYLPARRGGQRVAAWVEYPVRFALGRTAQ